MGIKHYVRLAAPGSLPVLSRKKVKWLSAPGPGPHKKNESVSAIVLLRDFLGAAKTKKEADFIFRHGGLLVDGKPVKDGKFPVGFADLITLPSEGKSYTLTIKNGKLSCVSLPKALEGKKYCQVKKKYTGKGGKSTATLHDGRLIPADKGTSPGDTVLLEVPSGKVSALLKRKEGASCIITSGKHAGMLGKLGKIMERKGSMDAEAEISTPSGNFTTVMKYVFVVDENYGSS